MIKECIHCKKSRGLGSDVWCGEGYPYESYMCETECPYFEPDDVFLKSQIHGNLGE